LVHQMNDTERFIKSLTGSAGTSMTWALLGDKGTAVEGRIWHVTCPYSAVADVLRDANVLGFGVHAQINEASGLRAADATRIRALYVDDDSGKLNPAALPVLPTMVVRGRRGVHCYWVLRDSLACDRWSACQKGIALALGTDDMVTDNPAGNMRVPGFANRKDGGSVPVTLVWDDGPTYVIADVTRVWPALVEPIYDGEITDLRAFPMSERVRQAQRFLSGRAYADGTHGKHEAIHAAATMVVLHYGVLDQDAAETAIEPWLSCSTSRDAYDYARRSIESAIRCHRGKEEVGDWLQMSDEALAVWIEDMNELATIFRIKRLERIKELRR
jgi:hypothetical protein